MSPKPHRNHNQQHLHSSSSHSSTIRTNSTTCTAMSNTTTTCKTSPPHHQNTNNYTSIIYAGNGNGTFDESKDFNTTSELSHSNNHHLQYLPICDALFNLICLTTYFCDVTFNLLLAWSIYSGVKSFDPEEEDADLSSSAAAQRIYPIIAFVCIFASLLTTQIVSLQWYYSGGVEGSAGSGSGKSPVTPIVLILHFCQFGILYRYFKLFTPLDLRHIKSEVRNLIILRLLHGFIQSLPLLICQLVNWLQWIPITVIGAASPKSSIDDLALVATLFSLFSISWALSSYTKNIHRENVHKLVLTWLGVLCQFGWRLGTIGSRTLTFALYTCVYKEWILIVICLHWGSMLLWLILSDSARPNENNPGISCQARVQSVNFRKLAVTSFIYTFCYVNVDSSGSSRSKSSIYYATMFLENSLLLGVSWIGMEQYQLGAAATDSAPIMVLYKEWIAGIIIGGFWIGMGFMGIYYQYCHVKKLGTGTGAPTDLEANSKKLQFSPAVMLTSTPRLSYEHEVTSSAPGPLIQVLPSGFSQVPGESTAQVSAAPIGPGVFNCRFNPALMKRKKKKPSTFVPPIPPSSMAMAPPANSESPGPAGKMSQAFWKKPLPIPAVPMMPHQHLHEGAYAYTSQDADTLKIAEWRQRSVAAVTNPAAAAGAGAAEYYEVNSDLDDYNSVYARRPHRTTIRSARSRRSRSRNNTSHHHHHHNTTHNRPTKRSGPNTLRHCNSESDLESAFGHLGRFTFAPPQPTKSNRAAPVVPAHSQCCTNSDDGDVDSGDGEEPEVETEAEAELDALYSRITAVPAPIPVQRPKPAPRTISKLVQLPQPETSL